MWNFREKTKAYFDIGLCWTHFCILLLQSVTVRNKTWPKKHLKPTGNSQTLQPRLIQLVCPFFQSTIPRAVENLKFSHFLTTRHNIANNGSKPYFKTQSEFQETDQMYCSSQMVLVRSAKCKLEHIWNRVLLLVEVKCAWYWLVI